MRLPDGSRSVQSPWVWRGFLLMSFIALGLCLVFAAGEQTVYAASWAVITVGWFGISMWLWRKHVHYDDAEWKARQSTSSAVKSGVNKSRVTRGGHVS